MRILSVTAGAGPMYCGSCVRDNALAAELMTRGHDVSLLPVYTPTLTDEPNVSDERVFFGGVSVYLQQHVPLFRRTPWLLDRLWDSAPVIKALAGRSISVDPHFLGEMTVSMLKGEEGFQRKEVLKLLSWLKTQPPYDVVSLPNSLLLGLAAPLKRTLSGPLLCTLQGEDLFLEQLPEPFRGQAKDLVRQHVPFVDGFVAVSGYYAGFMSRYLDIPREKIHVVPLGINLDGYAPTEPAVSRPFTVGYFARVGPQKGLHLLCEAYQLMRHERGLAPSRLDVAGYLAPEHRSYLQGLEARMRDWGLGDEFRYRGVLDRREKIAFLHELNVLAVPSVYVEPKGMYVLEAMASGVPVVEPRHGAFPEIIERTGGGLLHEPNDVGSLAEALLSLSADPQRARELGRKGEEGVRRDYGVARMAEKALEVYTALAAPERPVLVETR